MIGGISVWQLLILLLIVVLVFGTKRLRNIGGDLGSAIKGFRKGMEEEPDAEPGDAPAQQLDAKSESAEAPQNTAPAANNKENDPAYRPPGTDV